VSEIEALPGDKNINQLEGISIVKVRDVEYKLDIDDSIWKKGPEKFAQIPAWSSRGQIRPESKRGLPTTNNTKWLKKMDPFANFQIFPSVDPYPSQLRQLFRILNEENPWISRAQTIIQKLVVTPFTTEIVPRDSDELEPEALATWQDTVLDPSPPFFDQPVTPNEIKKYIDKMAQALDLKDIIFDAYMFAREQGRTAIGMFPEQRDPDTGKYVMPQALRLIRPELLRRPIVNFDTSELVAVEVTGLVSNGSRFDANRLVYIYKSKNLDLFGDFYGRSDIRALVDVGKVLLIIYGRDYESAAINTWHTPHIFKHTVPGKDFSTINTIMDNFNTDLANNAGKDISVSHNVELLNPSGSNPGDIAGLSLIENQCIDTIAGFNNIPPFMFAKGKAGRLGGNANKEEIDSFLTTEVEPEQEMLEQVIERQFYDRVLAVMFDVEPRDVGTVPVKIEHDFETPVIETEVDPAKFNMMMQLVNMGAITMEAAMDKLGMRDMLKEDSSTGGDVTPATKTWPTSSMAVQWPVSASQDHSHEQMHNSKIELLNAAKDALRGQKNEPGWNR
jgi:hypothetical protein